MKSLKEENEKKRSFSGYPEKLPIPVQMEPYFTGSEEGGLLASWASSICMA